MRESSSRLTNSKGAKAPSCRVECGCHRECRYWHGFLDPVGLERGLTAGTLSRPFWNLAT